MKKNKSKSRWFSLPDSTLTKSTSKYLREWRRIYTPIAKATRSRCFGFDPDLSFVSLDFPNHTWSLNRSEAIALSNALRKSKTTDE